MFDPTRTYKIEPLGEEHNRAAFTCLDTDLTTYLTGEKAVRDRDARAAAIHVWSDDEGNVLGYFTLSTSSLQRTEITAHKRGHLPDGKLLPYPSVNVTLLGRLAIHSSLKGQGLGEVLITEALKKAYMASKAVASFAVIVDAKNARVARIYEELGFIACLDTENRLFIPMSTVEEMLLAS